MKASEKHSSPQKRPVRTCIGCRTRAQKSALVRLVFNSDTVVADFRQRLPGRGAYLHPRSSCVRGVRRGQLGRAFRQEIPQLDLETLTQTILLSRAGEEVGICGRVK